jgi:TRAP-type C4-dicarboxylate transport system substrate-binding protein
MPPSSAIAVGYEWWADEFEKRTNGRYKVETYPLSQLVPDSGSLDAIKGGVCEIIMTSTGSKANDFPLAGVTGLPTLSFHQKGVTVEDYLASFKAVLELYEIPEVKAEYNDYHLIAPFEIDPTYLITRDKLVRVPDDLKGLLVGGAAGSMSDLIKAKGAASVSQIPPQAYMNMDKGVTTGAFMTYAMIGPYKMFEIADYILTQTFTAGSLIVLANPAWYNSLPPADRDIFNTTWEDAKIVCAQGMYDENVHSKAAIEASGITITHPTIAESLLWTEAAEKYAFATWKKDAQNLGASAALADKVLTTWQALLKKYRP